MYAIPLIENHIIGLSLVRISQNTPNTDSTFDACVLNLKNELS